MDQAEAAELLPMLVQKKKNIQSDLLVSINAAKAIATSMTQGRELRLYTIEITGEPSNIMVQSMLIQYIRTMNALYELYNWNIDHFHSYKARTS